MAVLALLLLTLGCDPGAFTAYEDEAPVVIIAGDESTEEAGAIVAGFAGQLDGRDVSRLAISGGTNTPFRSFVAWDGDSFGIGEDPAIKACPAISSCPAGHGAAIAGIPSWRPDTPSEQRLCLIGTAPAAGAVTVRCETSPEMMEQLEGEAGIELGASIAPLALRDPLGAAVLGAPFAADGRGAVYVVPHGDAPEEIALTVDLPPDAHLGTTVATAPHPDGTLIAASAPGTGGMARIVVAIATAGGAVVRGCIDSSAGGFGGALAAGDLDGDMLPEVIVGSTADAAMRLEGVAIHDGRGLPAAGGSGCPAWTTAAAVVACPAADPEVSCSGSAFGAAIAIGDVDADGTPDLVVGAPFAEVAGAARAGAAFVLAGGWAGWMPSRTTALRPTTSEADDTLGASVTMLPAGDRDFPAVGAPGSRRALVFRCPLLTDCD